MAARGDRVLTDPSRCLGAKKGEPERKDEVRTAVRPQEPGRDHCNGGKGGFRADCRDPARRLDQGRQAVRCHGRRDRRIELHQLIGLAQLFDDADE
jgi:hypothetical protein